LGAFGHREAMIEGQFTAVAAVRAARFALLEAALAAAERLRKAGRLVYVGAGTSGRLAVQDGAELVPTFSWPQERLLLLIAGGRNALLRSVEGAEVAVDQAPGLLNSTTSVAMTLSSLLPRAVPRRSPCPA